MNLAVKVRRSLYEEYFLVPVLYEGLIGNGRTRTEEMEDVERSQKYRLGFEPILGNKICLMYWTCNDWLLTAVFFSPNPLCD